jgi:putative ABC transport system ATP-binding protein
VTGVLAAEGLRHRVGASQLELLRDVDISVDEGEALAIEGRSGSGKSTLLSILGLLLEPQHGRVTLHGRDVSTATDRDRTRLRSRSIGFVFQNYSLIPSRSAWQNVSLPLLARREVPLRDHRRRALTALSQVGLEHHADLLPAQLSGGEQQRVAIARAIVLEPSLILADEPTGALDVDTGSGVLELMLSMVRETQRALVLVTHDPIVAAQCDRCCRLTAGALQ